MQHLGSILPVPCDRELLQMLGIVLQGKISTPRNRRWNPALPTRLHMFDSYRPSKYGALDNRSTLSP